MTVIPTLKTERLLLRAPTFDDWPDFWDLMKSERSVYMGGPFSAVHAWGDFCQGIAQWQMFGFGSLSIEVISTNQCVGRVEINYGPRCPEPELGWQVFDSAEGKGYAFEAATEMRRWAFEEREMQTLVSYIDPRNQRSQGLAERLGAALDETAEKQDPDDLVYRHS
ncbi:GNAT family N-acetyltransferase [Leisingera sp. M527]|uniref:GNAT family N-acetyltransferase n=1 Tax=Leisingera sp. M527 TaxID=2867014 RepID=UPI0021A6070F|nr:GNAT family N-acetyltransferase [Leisingera sp. M527]UWQ32178.1 GNAT family N-acetyltransferase [Leisingera sp. M527]